MLGEGIRLKTSQVGLLRMDYSFPRFPFLGSNKVNYNVGPTLKGKLLWRACKNDIEYFSERI